MNFHDHHCHCKQLKDNTFTITSWHNRKTSLLSERQFTTFSCLCLRLIILSVSMESFQKDARINPTLASRTPCHGCVLVIFSPIKMLHSLANTLYSENNAFRAGTHFSGQAPHRLTLLADSSLATLLIDCTPAHRLILLHLHHF